MSGKKYSYEERLKSFMKRIQYRGDCWIWTGSKVYGRSSIYGQFYNGDRNELAHRYSYGNFVMEIPRGMTIDHECRKTLCVNPNHLRPMTLRENILIGTGPTAKNAKKTHCPKGHEYTKDNIVGAFRNARECRRCSYDRTNLRKKNKRRAQSALDGKL